MLLQKVVLLLQEHILSDALCRLHDSAVDECKAIGPLSPLACSFTSRMLLASSSYSFASLNTASRARTKCSTSLCKPNDELGEFSLDVSRPPSCRGALASAGLASSPSACRSQSSGTAPPG